MEWIIRRVVDQVHCGISMGNTIATDCDLANYTVILTESLEVSVLAVEAEHKEAKPLGLQVHYAKTNVQVSGGMLDETVEYVHACGEVSGGL